MQDVIKKIYDYSLEDIMGERFGRYAKTIIQDRAIPDVRDGLKPVQRRILFAMYKTKNTHDKGYVKCAATVGEVLGKYHPHGDSSVYDAMVRMSQWWKQNNILVDIHGNNGSMDGDSAAAYRYTEARLSKISSEFVKDLEKDTVTWAPNFDDRFLEPTVLPCKFPNLLVNGSTGISAGYATNIPPHNLGEIIDATIKRIDSENCRLETILEIVKGPDFPTGGIVEGKDGIKDAYETGRGRVIVKSKITINDNKKLKQIVITEIPFEVNKALLVKKIDEIRIDKKIDGILEVRDESDRNDPVRIVIDIKNDANQELIINYLLKNTELQVSYNFNMVAIVRNRPYTLGILAILDAYIEYVKEVITRRTKFDLDHAKKQVHIVEGLVKALGILDQVIKTIRQSSNKNDAKNNLVKEYDFTLEQADAIVMLQLYRLTNTDVSELIKELENLRMIIIGLESILEDNEKLKAVIKEELRNVKKEYATDRKSLIKDEITEIKIDTTKMIPKEDVVIVITNEGYVKRVSTRSYNSNEEETLLKENDYVKGLYAANTLDTLLLFTNKGNYIYLPVYELPDLKWKEMGKHISNIISVEAYESIVGSTLVNDFNSGEITLFTKNGMIKKTNLIDFKVQRYSKPIKCINLKASDELVSISNKSNHSIIVITKNGLALRFSNEEVTTIGLKGSGVKAISLKNDEVVSAYLFDNEEFLALITDKGTGKRVRLNTIDNISRARKGVQIIRDVKTNPYHIIKAFVVDNSRQEIGIKNGAIEYIKISELPIADRYSTGSNLSKNKLNDAFMIESLNKKEEVKEEIEILDDPSLKEIDDKILTIDDFLGDFIIDEK